MQLLKSLSYNCLSLNQLSNFFPTSWATKKRMHVDAVSTQNVSDDGIKEYFYMK